MIKGNELEKLAGRANLNYRQQVRALILKIPVPIILTSRGLVAQESTVDFAGIVEGGYFLAFDAKETQNKTSFPLKNIKQHQVTYLNYVQKLGGYAFFMIHFKKVHKDKVYITPMYLINNYIEKNDRQSIPISEFKDEWLADPADYLNKVLELDFRRSNKTTTDS